MVKVYSIETYKPKSTDKFLFDTNILVLLYNSLNPDLAETKSDIYSNFMAKIIKSGATIYLTSLNLAEFVNVLISREYNIKKQYKNEDYQKKRDFRNSEDYFYAIEQIKPIIRRMLSTFVKLSDNFEELIVDNLIDDIKIDFNDEYFNYLCNYNNIKLITDDTDYVVLSSPLEVITANKKMLVGKSL